MEFDNGIWNFPENNVNNGNEKHGRRFPVTFIAVICIIAFVLGGAIGGYLVYREEERRYAEQNELIESFSDLITIMNFAEETYYEDISYETLLEYACRGVIDNLDVYSSLLTREDLEYIEQSAQLSALYGKLGITVNFSEAGRFCVTHVAKGSPAHAYNAGKTYEEQIVPGDYIRRVNGKEVEGLYQEEITALLSGYVGTTVTLDLYSGEGASYREKNGVTLTRMAFTTSEAYSVLDFSAYSPELSYVPSNIGYVSLNSFTGTADEDFAREISAFQEAGKTKLILDLRGNGGGSGTILANIASYLIDDQEHSQSQHVITLHFKDGTESVTRTKSNNYIYKNSTPMKIAVLVDGNSASASECLVGAMLTSSPAGLTGGSCELFGTTTYGKGIGQMTYAMPSTEDPDYEITVSVGEYSFSGDVSAYVQGATGYTDRIHGKGLSPRLSNRAVSSSPTLVGDEVFNKAVEFLKNQG